LETDQIDSGSKKLICNVDFSEVRKWYLGWKSLFPSNLVTNIELLQKFNVALDVMRCCIDFIQSQAQSKGTNIESDDQNSTELRNHLQVTLNLSQFYPSNKESYFYYLELHLKQEQTENRMHGDT
jgi:hypothetical protein